MQELKADKKQTSGLKIVVADDRDLNIQVIRANLEALGIVGTVYCFDGQQVIQTCMNLLDDAIKNMQTPFIKPIDLVLTDF